jgi:hypothetical protein
LFEFRNVSSQGKVKVTVWDNEKIGKPKFEGQVEIEMDELYQSNQTLLNTYTLLVRPGKKDKVKGTITIEMKFEGNK